MSLFIAMLPFALLLLAYVVGSDMRLAANPDDKLLPGLGKIFDAVHRLAFEPDVRSGDFLLWADTLASLVRLGVGVLCATLLGAVFGVAIGLIPYIRSGLSPLVAVVSMTPPLTVITSYSIHYTKLYEIS